MLFSLPGGFIATAVYLKIIRPILTRLPVLALWVRRVSLMILLGVFVEMGLLACLGPVRSRTMLGPFFGIAHLVLFFLGVPALASVLMLMEWPRKSDRPSRVAFPWYAIAGVCSLLSAVLVVTQYIVSESLYGAEYRKGLFQWP